MTRAKLGLAPVMALFSLLLLPLSTLLGSSVRTSAEGERWVFNVTFAEHNVSESLLPYLLTEEEWPPVVIDVDWLMEEEKLGPENLSSWRQMIEEYALVHIFYPPPPGTANYSFVEGFLQAWGFKDMGAVMYGLLRFRDRDEASQWILEAKGELGISRFGGNVSVGEYSMGDVGLLFEHFAHTTPEGIHHPAEKYVCVMTREYGFLTGSVISYFQPDEMLPERMAGIVAQKLSIPEPALLSILSILGLILLPTHLCRHARHTN